MATQKKRYLHIDLYKLFLDDYTTQKSQDSFSEILIPSQHRYLMKLFHHL